MKYIVNTWLPLAIATVVLALIAYGLVQQSARMAANDPQLQMARDAALALAAGGSPGSVVPDGTKVNLNTSLAPFISVFDEAGTPLESSGVLDGKPPVLPTGVLTYTREVGEDVVTWQPRAGVRIAAVVVRSGGEHPRFVLAGRSLLSVERRARTLFVLTMLGLFAALLTSYAAVWLFRKN